MSGKTPAGLGGIDQRIQDVGELRPHFPDLPRATGRTRPARGLSAEPARPLTRPRPTAAVSPGSRCVRDMLAALTDDHGYVSPRPDTSPTRAGTQPRRSQRPSGGPPIAPLSWLGPSGSSMRARLASRCLPSTSAGSGRAGAGRGRSGGSRRWSSASTEPDGRPRTTSSRRSAGQDQPCCRGWSVSAVTERRSIAPRRRPRVAAPELRRSSAT